MAAMCAVVVQLIGEMFFFSQDLENQSLTEAETWREQQLQFEEQQALHNRAKQEAEAEVERYKQVMGDVFLKWQLF